MQTKLTVGPAGDQYEQEADRVARDVVTRITSQSSATVDNAQRQDIEDEELLQGKRLRRQEDEELLQGKWLQRQPEEEELMMKPVVGMEGGDLDSATDSAIESSRGSGSPLPDPVRRDMESAFGGTDFGNVRVHTGAESDRLTQSLSARAFTTGSDIFVRNGDYQPTTSSGQELLAHELTHVMQQGGGQ